MKRYTLPEITLIKRLRMRYKPAEIAQMVGRTKGAIHQILYRESLKGAKYPKLRHGNMKYDCQKAQAWRAKLRGGKNYPIIQKEEGVHPVVISRILAAEARGELRW
jgi:IS30 family transposase